MYLSAVYAFALGDGEMQGNTEREQGRLTAITEQLYYLVYTMCSMVPTTYVTTWSYEVLR